MKCSFPFQRFRNYLYWWCLQNKPLSRTCSVMYNRIGGNKQQLVYLMFCYKNLIILTVIGFPITKSVKLKFAKAVYQGHLWLWINLWIYFTCYKTALLNFFIFSCLTKNAIIAVFLPIIHTSIGWRRNMGNFSRISLVVIFSWSIQFLLILNVASIIFFWLSVYTTPLDNLSTKKINKWTHSFHTAVPFRTWTVTIIPKHRQTANY